MSLIDEQIKQMWYTNIILKYIYIYNLNIKFNLFFIYKHIYIYIHTHTQWNTTQHKKNEIIPFVATWMDLEIIIQSEVNQTEKDKYHDITYIWNLKYDTNEFIYETETDSQTQRTDVQLKNPGGRTTLFSAVFSHSVVSNSLRSHGLQPTRLLCP